MGWDGMGLARDRDRTREAYTSALSSSAIGRLLHSSFRMRRSGGHILHVYIVQDHFGPNVLASGSESL